MIIKWLHIIFLVLILSSMVMSNNNDTIHRNKRIDHKCKLEEIKTVLKKDIIHRFAKNFNQLENLINRNYCKIDSITLRSYLIQIASRRPDSSYSDDEDLMFDKAWYLVTRSNWGEDVEKLILRNMDYFKKKFRGVFFRRLGLLVERSPNWYQYMLETYNSIDTMNYSDRYWIYWALIERFKDTSDTSVQNRVESILYAVMKKDKSQSTLMMVDEYLSSKSDSYKNSRQRLQLFKDRDKKLEPIKDRNYLVGYFNYSLNIQKYLNKKWKLTDYVPPFTIE